MTAILKRILGEGFRVFFLLAGLYAVFALVVWEGWLGLFVARGRGGDLPVEMPPMWHAHEMIFGYATAALGGFLLTAVPNWTGAKAARHLFIGAASGAWLAGRLAVWFWSVLPEGLVAGVELAFLPILAAKVATQLIRRPKPQNLMFLIFLTIIWVGDLLVQLEWLGLSAGTADLGLRIGLLGLCLMIAVLGGRVTPAFTRNAMKRAERLKNWPVSRRPLEAAGIATLLLVVLALPFDVRLAGALAVISGVFQLARLAGWRSGWTLNQPILWSLHLPFALLGVGLILLGLAWLGLGSEVAALHVLGIGTVGGMTLAVMSRAILGHTGQPLIAPRSIAIAFGLVALAAALRWAGSELGGVFYWPLVLSSGALWILAFSMFVVRFWGALTGPRPRRAPPGGTPPKL